MAWPRREARVADAVQHAVDAADRVAHAELALEDADNVPAAERADAVFGQRPGVEAGLEPPDLLGGELGRRAAGLAGDERLEPAASVAAGPLVDEPRRPAQAGGDLVAFELIVENEQDGAVAVALSRVAFASDASAEPFKVVGAVEREPHARQLAGHPRKARIGRAHVSATIRIRHQHNRRQRLCNQAAATSNTS